MIRCCLVAALATLAGAVDAQVGYTPFSNYQNVPTAQPFYYSSPSYYQRVYGTPVVGYPYNVYRPSYYSRVDLRRRSPLAAMQETTRHLQGIDRSLQSLSLQRQATTRPVAGPLRPMTPAAGAGLFPQIAPPGSTTLPISAPAHRTLP